MELPQSRTQPQVELMLDFASIIRIGAIRFAPAGIAMMSRRSVLHYTALVISFHADQVISLGALPTIKPRVVLEAGQLILVCAAPRMPGESFQGGRHDEQK